MTEGASNPETKATFPIECLAWSPSGTRVLTGGGTSGAAELKVWDPTAGHVVLDIPEPHANYVACCAWSPDGTRMISGSAMSLVYDCKLKVWEADTGRSVMEHLHDRKPLWACDLSPDGRRLVTGQWLLEGVREWDTPLRAWDLKCGRVSWKGDLSNIGIRACAYSPDGRLAATGTVDRVVRIWNADTGDEMAQMEGHGHWIEDLEFSPCGRWLLSSSLDGRMKMWRTGSWEEERTLDRHASYVMEGSHSPDGRYVVSASFDRTVRVWDARSGEELARYSGGVFRDAKFSPNGRMIAAGDDAGDVCFIEVRGLNIGPLITTAMHLYHCDREDWGSEVTARCGECGNCAVVPASVLDTIASIGRHGNSMTRAFPASFLTDEVFDVPGLLAGCPHCGRPLRYNPYIVDNRALYDRALRDAMGA